MIGKLKGVIDSYRRGFRHPRRQWRRLSRALLGAHVAGIAAHRRAGDARHRDARARGPDSPVRFFDRCRARMVSAVADRAGRRHQGGARRARHAQARRSRLGDCDARQGDGRARRPASARKSPSASSPNSRTRRRPIPMSIRRWCGSPARSTRNGRRSRSPMRSPRWSISATRSRRPPPPSPPPCAARGDGIDVRQLIRLGLKELAK